MRSLLLLTLLASPVLAEDLAPVGVTGTATVRQIDAGRWGGAAPSPEEENRRLEQPFPRPLANQILLVRPGAVNRNVEPRELTTDAKGHFSLELTPGTWCVVTQAKRKVVEPLSARRRRKLEASDPYTDQACMERLKSACDAVLKVTAAPKQVVKINIETVTGGAPPCWHGPGPPSAAPRE